MRFLLLILLCGLVLGTLLDTVSIILTFGDDHTTSVEEAVESLEPIIELLGTRR